VSLDPGDLWQKLGDVPVTEDGVYLDGPFLRFPVGTEVEAVWRWFEATFPGFSVAEAMGHASPTRSVSPNED
jgi:hypothetical protein